MKTLVCTNCKIQFLRDQSQITSSKLHNVENIFCTRSCSVSWNNKHRVKKVQRVSKLEKWIHGAIKEAFPALDVIYNPKDALEDEGEVDIWIPSLKLGFEIQGPSHYFPIFGEEKLAAEQANDAKKKQKAIELGIDLVDIDASTFKTFKKNYKLILIVDSILSKIREKQKAI